VKKLSLVATAIGFGGALTLAPPLTMLAQDGAVLEKRWSAERVEVGCCWTPARLGQVRVFASVVPASLTTLSSTPGEEEAEGPREMCWVIADLGNRSVVAESSAQGEEQRRLPGVGGWQGDPLHRRKGEMSTSHQGG
jgi:hypothetical protein